LLCAPGAAARAQVIARIIPGGGQQVVTDRCEVLFGGGTKPTRTGSAARKRNMWLEDVPVLPGVERSATGRRPLVEEYPEVCKVPLVPRSLRI
jgi:hypothetical protein